MQANNGNEGLRPIETIEPHEWAKLEKARHTTDPRKLEAMLPAWLKKALSHPPKRFAYMPDPEPVFPAWTRRKGLGTCPPPTIPKEPESGWQSVADYVAAFDEANGFRKVKSN